MPLPSLLTRTASLLIMVFWDYLVLIGYFAVMIAIGVYSSMRIKAQEDFFMGGRSFGKLLQTFAAFGAGTGSSDPVNTGRTTFTSGMSGMWSVMYWLLVTPFYWITGVWYRRMRHLTLGDWFVERYDSRALGAGYCVFGILFYMVYGSMLFSAIGKVAAPLIEIDTFTFGGHQYGIEYLLVPIIGVVVLFYGILGGLHAAYYTDLIQGLCIIFLSIVLIPYGLAALVERFGDPATEGMMAGFTYLHQQLPEEHFHLVGSTSSSEFPLHRIIAVVIINLIGIVVQPHFIATGGGSAKNENTARLGLVTGNFLKRFCTIGWVLTALIALALYANNPELAVDPDKTWGIASRELLGPGLTGLMLACLLAALMSSVDAYMIVGSGLVVRNLYAPYINPGASEAQYIKVARLTGVLVVGGAVIVSLFYMNVFAQLQLTWVFNILFAAPFWIGMYWRRATLTAAWVTVAYSATVFFLIPFAAPRLIDGLRTDPRFSAMNQIVETTTIREAAPSDVQRRLAAIDVWQSQRDAILQNDRSDAEQQAALAALGPQPEERRVGEELTVVERSGGQGIFWPSGLVPLDINNAISTPVPQPVGEPIRIGDRSTQQVYQYPEGTRFRGEGNFRFDFLLYSALGIDLTPRSNATLDTLDLPPKIVTPFLVMIFVSLFTRSVRREVLDRYYAKMKTMVDADPEIDRRNLEVAYANPEALEHRKLFPGSSLEVQKPTRTDVVGFVACFAIVGLIIVLAMLVARIGA
jgi:solute:Na+ symporter, SSS family